MDKKLNEVTKVTDMAYVPVIMADGSIGQIAKSDLASVVAGVIGNADKSKAGLMSDLQFKAIFGGKGGNDSNVGKFMRFDMNSTRASILLQITQNSSGSAGLYSLVVNGYDAPKLKALNVGIGSSTIEFFYKRDPSSLKTSILIKSSRDFSNVYATSPEEVRFIGLEDSSNGYSSLIPKVDVFGYNSLAELAGGVAGQIGIKSGVIEQDTPTKMKLGSGFLFMNIGGSHSSLYHLDYWTTDVTLIGGKPLDTLGTIVQDANDKYTFTITINGTKARYFFIGFKFT